MTEKFYQKTMRQMLTVLFAVVFVSLAVPATAQRTVRGSVKDTGGSPLVGVSVIAVGTSAGIVTDINGNYSLNIPKDAKVLMFSYLGYKEVTVSLESGRTVIDINMEESSTVMDEVVVIGYGVQKKRDVTGSVASVNSKVLEAMPTATVTEALSGRMAGVQVTTTEGGPDAEIKIRVRGGGSVTQDNSPLYIVDGFPVSSINDIASSDIESIDVLKDVSSTAIYGARGANGVIIVTTKSGKSGKTSVTFNAYAGVKQISKYLDVLDPYEYVLWQYEVANYRASVIDDNKTFTKYYGAFDDLELYKAQSGTNWQQEVFGRTAVTQNYNLGILGGAEKVQYNINLNHIDDQSIMIASGYVRDNITAKLKGDINKQLAFDFNARWSRTVINGAGTSTEGSSSVPRLRHAIKYAPTAGISEFVESDDDYLAELDSSTEFNNPVEMTYDEWRQTTRITQNYNGALTWKIVKGLTYRADAGIELGNEGIDRFYGLTTSIARNNNGRPVASKYDKQSEGWRISNVLTWMPSLGKSHSLTVMAGQEASSTGFDTTLAEAMNFSQTISRVNALANMNLGEAQPLETYVSPRTRLLSYFGRVQYSWRDKWLFTSNFRADGSSKFAPGNRWGYFPSVAIGWRMSEEPWMISTRNWLDSFKWRISYGGAGNNRISDDLWRYLYQTGTSSKPISINGSEQTVLEPSADLPNFKLKWETTVTRDLGIDASLWNGRLIATVDLYYNTTSDLLIRASIPSNSGFSYQYQNIGRTSNRGIEVVLNGTLVQKKDFRLGADFNISFNRNRIDELGESKSYTVTSRWYNSTNPDADFLVEQGQPIGLIYGYKTEGMYSFDDFDYSYNAETGKGTWTLKDGQLSSTSVTSSPEMPGSLKISNLVDDGKIDSNDRTVIGNTQPKFTGGFNLNMQWKGFDVAAYFNFVYGNDVYNANKLDFSSYPLTRRYGNLIADMADRFTYIDRSTGESLINDYDRLKAANTNAKLWTPIISQVPIYDWAVEDGSFLRLNNVTIGYTLPQNLTKRIGVSRLRVYVTGYNLYLLTAYTGYDPEVDSKRSTPLTPGVDYSAFPRARQIVAGINVTF